MFDQLLEKLLESQKHPWEMTATGKDYAELSIDDTNRAAFGFAESDVKTLMPEELNVKYKEDIKNPIEKQKNSGLSKKKWAETIDLSEPIQVSYEKGKFYIEDGHHRYYASKILNKPLNVDSVDFKDKPHRLIIKKALSKGKHVPKDVLLDYKGEVWADEALDAFDKETER